MNGTVRLIMIVARRMLVLAVLGGVITATAGCSTSLMMPSLDDRLKGSLASMIESAQDDLWQFRGALATDPEGTLPGISFVSDARPAYGDPAFAVGEGAYTLLGVASSPDAATLTLATSAGASTGGGWFYESRNATVCFTLRFPTTESAIHTGPADCSDGQGHRLSDVENFFERHGDPIPFEELDVRATVTEADFQPLHCQCYSGSECDCPGG
ncbi:hypothetical protein [Microbacterium murale]|uniref:Lipoprotein n=1 Tax=Microbacterium murale TaxID=1081040 RepID=A0ABQ1RDH9_9MICO|nr:hypothetical protein [Microbacterium murale]GGD64761.1 hypothetical protein GCM10007269_04950 [Microbacterium murale]